MIADRVTGNLSADTVSVDNEDAGTIGARHLIDLGHKDLLIAASSLSLANIRQRCSGATEAMRSRGLPRTGNRRTRLLNRRGVRKALEMVR